MRKFLNVSFAILCGASVLATSNAGFAVIIGEMREVDEEWNKATLSLSSNIKKLVEEKGTAENKITSLRKTDILDKMDTLQQFFLNMRYEPAPSYFNKIADDIASWVFSPQEKEPQYTNFFKKIVAAPASIQDHVGNISQLISSFDELKNKESTATVRLPDWSSYLKIYEKARSEDKLKEAYDALQNIFNLAEDGNAASTWMAHSWEAFQDLIKTYGDLKDPYYVEIKNSPNIWKEEESPIFNQDNDWTSLCQTFLENYKNEPEVAEYALNQLHILSETSEDIKGWLQSSKEVLNFAIREENHKNQQAINVEEYRKSPFGKVGSHKEYKVLRDRLKPIRDVFAKLLQNADVHLLDNFVKANEQKLINIAQTLFPENGKLKLEEVKTNLKKLIEERKLLLKDYKYERKDFTKEEMFKYIDQFYKVMPDELCSHAYELGVQLLNSPFQPSEFGIYRLFDAIVENYQTQGGCLVGRKDRQFGALVSMLVFCGLDEQTQYK